MVQLAKKPEPSRDRFGQFHELAKSLSYVNRRRKSRADIVGSGEAFIPL